MKKLIAVIFILAVVGLAIGFLVFNNKPTGAPPLASKAPIANVPTNNPIKFTGQAKIEMPAIVPAGNELTISKVLMPGHGFVVIKNQAGKVVGASNLIIFPETDNFKMAIALLSGKTYTAELHGDNGNGLFDEPTDPPLVIGGKTISTTFKVK